jgi:hypothetical protein
MGIFRAYLIDFVRIVMLFLGIRIVLEYLNNPGFDPIALLREQIPSAALLAGLFSAIRLLIKPKAKN